jgi:NDP-4-keto-2,6-dideoxyhexose 3-C-methyltransferase
LAVYSEIKSCRICGNQELDLILELGILPLTGVFPNTKIEEIPAGPLSLVKCSESNLKNSCGLVQLKESYNSDLMYGQNYGYRSGLNKSMVRHLHDKANKILDYVTLNSEDIIVDTGSNDSTLLQAYPKNKSSLV